MFTGEYRHSVDDKGRVAVPVRFRAQLQGGAFVSRWIDECVAIFPRAAWDALAARVAGLPISDPGARSFSRFVFSGAYEVEIDRQGRVLVPAGLREFAALDGDVVVVGARDHVELWEPRRWDDYSREMNSPDVLATHLQGLGI